MPTPQNEPPQTLVEQVTDGFTIIHCNFALTSLEGQQVSRNETPCGEDWSPLALELLDIVGLDCVQIKPYGVGLHRASPLFPWDPIITEAQRLLNWVGHAFNPNAPDRSRGKSDLATTLTKMASEGDVDMGTCV